MNNTYINDEYFIRLDARSFYTVNVWNSMSKKQHKEIIDKLTKIDNGNYSYYQKLLLNKMNLDDIRLFFKHFWNGKWWCCSSKFPISKPITFTEFLNNRSLSRYIQKARKEVNKNAKIYINHT